MPMAINSKKDYENVVNVSWFSQEQSADDLTYVLHASSSYLWPFCD